LSAVSIDLIDLIDMLWLYGPPRAMSQKYTDDIYIKDRDDAQEKFTIFRAVMCGF
jgi:hypothetical protein